MTKASRTTVWIFALFTLVPVIAVGQTPDEIAALEAQKKATLLVKEIEEAKEAAGASRRNQLLNEIQTKTSLADEKKKQADVEKAELKAKLPETTATPLAGGVGTEGMKLLALEPIVRKLDEAAGRLCQTSAPDHLLIFDRSLVDGIVSARLLEAQIEDLINANRNIVGASPAPVKGQPTVTPKTAALLAVGAVTTGIKAVADLTALFKTNVTTGTIDLTEPKQIFHTMLAGHCGPRILAIPGSYVGELDDSALNAMLDKVKDLVAAQGDTSELADKKRRAITKHNATLKKAEEAKNKDLIAVTKVQLEAEQDALAPLDEVLKQSDAFLLSLKTTDTTGTGPLVLASRFRALEARLKKQNTVMIEIDVRAEGVTVVKDNIFTGQKLRIAGAAILSYKVLNIDGSIKFAKVEPLTTPFTEFDLRQTN